MNALAVDPSNGALYGAQNGRDQPFQNWPKLFDATDDALLPAEELLRIDRGKAVWLAVLLFRSGAEQEGARARVRW